MEKLKIEYVDINSIKPYKKNPRKNEEAIPYVMESIKQFGFKNPVILDKDNVIVAGHTRIESAKRLGITEIPCIYADDLTDEQIRAFRLADNKVAEIAEWDIDLLDTELDDILNIDMSDFGFDLGILDSDEFGTDFELAEGDRDPIITMSITLSDIQAERVNEAISKMKQTDTYKNYEDEFNKNSNGNSLYLVVEEWLQQKI